MRTIKSTILILTTLISINLICSSCDQIISMITEEFNSERTPAVPKQPAPSSISSEEPFEEQKS